MTARDVWRWTDERGVQRLVGTDELRAALASSILPPSTLVWREGMKEWAPASSMPELASAAFAAGADSLVGAVGNAPNPPADGPRPPGSPFKPTAQDGSAGPRPAGKSPGFDPRSTAERRATLVGLPPPVEFPLSAASNPAAPVAVPGPADRSDRSPVTQVPPFGAPPPGSLGLPAMPRIPGAGLGDKLKPRRTLTSATSAASTEIDSNWATTTRSDEDDTIPRRARPSELAAAAAASADATSSLREGRARPRVEIDGRKASPPPLPGLAKAGPARPPLPEAASAAHPPADAKPPAETPAADAARPMPPKPQVRVHAPPPPPRPIKAPSAPTVPSVRMKPPPITLAGLPRQTAEAAVEAEPALPIAPEPFHEEVTSAAAPAFPPVAAAPDVSKVVRTLASARDSIESIPGLAEAVAAAASFDEKTEQLVAPALPYAAPVEMGAAVREDATSPLPDHGHHGSNGAAAPPPALPAARSNPPPPLPPPAQRVREGAARPPLPSYPLPTAAPVVVAAPVEAGPAGEDPRPVGSDQPAVPAEDLGVAPAGTSARPPPREPLGETQPGLRAARRPLGEVVSVPLTSLLGAGGLLIGMVVTAFFVGRASSGSGSRLTAHPSLAVVPALAHAALPPPLKPCWMVKQPAMWAPQASRTIPFDAVATRGGSVAVGYARDARQAMGIEVDLSSGEVRARLDDKAKEEIERVVPTSGVEFRVARAGAGGALSSPIDVPATPPFAVGLAEGAIALASPPEGASQPLWPLPGKESGDEGLGAASVRPAGDTGFTLVFRRSGTIWGGFIGADRKARELVKVEGSSGAVGKPASAWNGREVAVIFADRPEAAGHYEIRIGHAPAGKIPTATAVIPLPHGGPGGDAFAPEIAGLADGRWLLMWTEGGAGARAVRAQTLAPDFHPLGDPIALSPPAGNYGQGVIGVVGDRAATVFLSKGSSSYELWGAVLQCGG